jgi:cytochrome c oxidase subunit 2
MNTEFSFMPEQASSFAADVDAVYGFLLLVSGVFTVLIAFLIMFFAIKYRRGSPADRTRGEGHFFLMELSWIVIPLLLTMVMFYWGAVVFFEQARPPAGAMEINCVGKQWMWKFQHPEGNSEINDLHVPLNQPVKINLISEDVIHSLYVPAFRVKHDVLPGRYTALWFKPTKVGRYHLFCAEYCGAKHSEMRGYVHVMEPAKYQEWLAGRSSTENTADAGAKLFEQLRCNTCHLGGGQQGRGPALEGLFGSTVRLQGGGTVIADENYIRESIVRPAAKVVVGYQPIMPTFEGQIGEEGLLQLIAEIKSLRRPDQTNPAEGSGTGPKRGDTLQQGPEQTPQTGVDNPSEGSDRATDERPRNPGAPDSQTDQTSGNPVEPDRQ